MRHPWPLLVLAAALACGGGDDDPAAPPRISQFFVRDPIGDTMASPHAVSRAHDVLSVEAMPQRDTLFVSLRFADSVLPFSSGARNALLGIIDIDVDDDPTTGLPAVADGFGATASIGAEWSLFLEDSTVGSTDQRVALLNLATDEVHWVPGRFDGTIVTARVPLVLLGASAGARLRIVGVFGSVERASDFVPNEGSVPIALP
jgi:hypothetical protein